MATEATIVRHTLIVGASYDYGRRIVGVGIVVREARRPGRRGPVVDQRCEAYRGVPPGLAEMFAVLRALELSAERGFRIVKVRSDYNDMRRQLKDAHKLGEGRDRHHIQGHILRLASQFDQVTFGYQPRRKNQNAYRLARMGREATPTTRNDLFAP